MRNAVADDDMLCDMYLQTVGQLASKGFLQYEISNFAKEGGKSRHNLKYYHGTQGKYDKNWPIGTFFL